MNPETLLTTFDAMIAQAPLRAGLAGVLLVTLLAAGALLLRERKQVDLQARLAGVLAPLRASPDAQDTADEMPSTPGRGHLLALAERTIAPLPLVGTEEQARIRLLLTRAGHRNGSVPLFLFAKLSLTVTLGAWALFVALVHPSFSQSLFVQAIVVLLAAGIGAYVPELILRSRASARQTAVNNSLPDALDLLVICAEAGLSLDVAIGRVAHELVTAAPELAQELDLTAAELRMLPERQEALDNLARRTNLAAVRSLVATLSQAQKYGTSLAQSMRVISAEVRQQRMLSLEERAARLPALISVPLILFILPAIFLVVAGPAMLQVFAMM